MRIEQFLEDFLTAQAARIDQFEFGAPTESGDAAAPDAERRQPVEAVIAAAARAFLDDRAAREGDPLIADIVPTLDTASWTLPAPTAAPNAPRPADGAPEGGSSAATPPTAGASLDAANAPAPSADGEPALDASGGGFWARFLSSVDRVVDIVDSLVDAVDAYLDRPGLSEQMEARLEAYLEYLDGYLARLDNLMEIVDRFAPPRFDGWIDQIRDRISNERDEIDAILNPPAPVETPEEDAPAEDDAPEGDAAPEDEAEYTADDFTGDGKVVVVIDSGWNSQFLGEDERPVAEVDFYDTNGTTDTAEVGADNDHGSWVDQVVRDVAEGVETIHLKVFPDGGGSTYFSVLENALDWVIEQVEASAFDIAAVNLSLGAGNSTTEVSTSLSDEFAALDDLGVFSVVAAGNSGQDGVQWLAADANAIAVSASTSSGAAAGFSQAHEDLTDIFAFGQSVRIEDETGGVDVVSGTSFAAPYVSAVAARLQEAAETLIDRSLTDEEFIEILQLSGDDLSGYASDADPDGYHIANADAALEFFIDNYRDYDTAA